MRPEDQAPIPLDVVSIDQRLRDERPQPAALELDRAKLRAMNRVGPGHTPRRHLPRSHRLVSVALVLALTSGGTAVLARTGGVSKGSSSSSAANSQYCPPTSQQPGQPKQPGPARCGRPKTK
jgi:hypothetical protein